MAQRDIVGKKPASVSESCFENHSISRSLNSEMKISGSYPTRKLSFAQTITKGLEYIQTLTTM